MRNLKKFGALSITTAMILSSLVGCGAAGANALTVTDGGKVLNIYCWNEEFKSRVTDHYPGYVEVDATHGKIGDVDVVWTITPNKDMAYQNNLDETLLKQAKAKANDRIDIFLVEADYALKYVDTDYTAPVSVLDITKDELSKQYTYTQDIVTDSKGQLKGISWQGCPGVLIYNRDAAKEVLGSDDPAKVQEYVKDWDTFKTTADKLADKGYKATATTNDTFRVFSNNVTSKWVDSTGKLTIDANIMKWVEMSKDMADKKQTGTADLWSDEWSKGFYPEGKVFCYFGPAWLIDFSMHVDEKGSIANAGNWGATTGPQGFYWGGTWICAANGTDNKSLVADIMRKLTVDDTVMKEIVVKDNDFVNNKTVMEEMAKDTKYGDAVLNGQNAIPMFCEGADKIDLSTSSAYDQGCNEEFQKAMKDYFDGNCDLDTALANFKKNIKVKYPNVVVD